MAFAKKLKTDKWFNNEIKRYNLTYTSYKNAKTTAERKPPITWGYSIE